jgi:hypothetical protein
MRTVYLRTASLIAVWSLIFGAAACAPTDDNDDAESTSSAHDTASKPSAVEQAADVAAAQSIDEIDLSLPPPDDLSSEDEKIEKNNDCCVWKDSRSATCRCQTVTGTPAGTYFECKFKGASTKRGSSCGNYSDCRVASGVCY